MRAWQIAGAFSIDALTDQSLEDPAPGPGQVAVRVGAVSLNFRDLLVIGGLYSRKVPNPLTVCSDCAGEVSAIGEGVSSVKPGDRVCATFMPAWITGEVDEEKARSARGAFTQGVLATTLVTDAASLVMTPPHLTDIEAATLPCAAVTAWNALVSRGGLRMGDTVLVQGSGGVSIFALQFAKLLGARVIATSSSSSKIARLGEIGADETINYVTTPDWEEAARKLTGGRGVDHVIEIGGAATFNKSVRAVRMGGRISVIGNRAQGTGEAPNLTALLMKSVCAQGVFVGSREMFEDMNRTVVSARLQPVVDRVFPFDSAPDAFRYFETGSHFGKVVVSTGAE
jgi:NADPH:quinone reductase-like Zn-dependent oxidoreductase